MPKKTQYSANINRNNIVDNTVFNYFIILNIL